MGRKLHPLLEYSILFVRPENSAQVSKKADTENGLQLCSRSERCVKLLLCSCATICVNLGATAGAWNFGLCATRSREPRQARKGQRYRVCLGCRRSPEVPLVEPSFPS